VAVALSRNERLSNGAVLILSEDRAIIVRTNEQRWMKLAPRDLDAAVALGYFIGNLHWRVRFEPGAILVALDGPEGDFQARLEAFLSSGEARMVRDA
jgi:urease accessory protein